MLPLTFREKQRLRDFLRECQHVRNVQAGARCTSWSDVKRCVVDYIMNEAEEEVVRWYGAMAQWRDGTEEEEEVPDAESAEWWVNSFTQTQTPSAASASAASDRDHCAVKRPLDDPDLHMDSTPGAGDSKGKTREKKTPKNRVEPLEPEPEEEFSSQPDGPDLEETSALSIDDDDSDVLVEVEVEVEEFSSVC